MIIDLTVCTLKLSLFYSPRNSTQVCWSNFCSSPKLKNFILGIPRGHFRGFSWAFGKLKPSPLAWNRYEILHKNVGLTFVLDQSRKISFLGS